MGVTVAILLGASRFPEYPGFVANRRFRKSKEDFLDYLQKPEAGLGVSEEHVLDLFNSPNLPHVQIHEIDGFLKKIRFEATAENNLIVYYVGHGMVPEGELLLALRSIQVRRERYTALSVRQLADTIKGSYNDFHFRRFVFLDCCFAAKALEAMQAGPVAASTMMALPFIDGDIEDSPDAGLRSGTALYCAVNKDSPALSPDHMPRTMFTDALVTALESGHSKLPPKLTMAELNKLVRRTLKARHGDGAVWPELHAPDQHDGDITQQVRLFPNAGGGEPAAPPMPAPAPVEELLLLKAQLQRAEHEAGAARAAQQSLASRCEQAESIAAAQRQELSGLRERMQALQLEQAALRESAKAAESGRAELVVRLQATQQQLASANAALESASPAIVESLKDELQRVKAEGEAKLTEEVMRRQQISDAHRADAQQADKRISDLGAEAIRLIQELQKSQQAAAAAQQRLAAAESARSSQQAELNTATAEIQALRGTVQRLTAELASWRKRVAEEAPLPAPSPRLGSAARWLRWISERRLLSFFLLFALIVFMAMLTQPPRQAQTTPSASGAATAAPTNAQPVGTSAESTAGRNLDVIAGSQRTAPLPRDTSRQPCPAEWRAPNGSCFAGLAGIGTETLPGAKPKAAVPATDTGQRAPTAKPALQPVSAWCPKEWRSPSGECKVPTVSVPTQPRSTCKSDEIWTGTACLSRAVQLPPGWQCNANEIWDGVSCKSIQLPAVRTCVAGEVLVGTQCVPQVLPAASPAR